MYGVRVQCEASEGDAPADAELGVEVPDMRFHGATGDEQALGDLGVGESLADERQHRLFGRRQAGETGRRSLARSASAAVDAELAQRGAQSTGVVHGAQVLDDGERLVEQPGGA